MLASILMPARPSYGWLSEETADTDDRLTRSRVFVVDPIDGTRAFIKGDPRWAVSIALVEAGRPRLGVLHLPALGLTPPAHRVGLGRNASGLASHVAYGTLAALARRSPHQVSAATGACR